MWWAKLQRKELQLLSTYNWKYCSRPVDVAKILHNIVLLDDAYATYHVVCLHTLSM